MGRQPCCDKVGLKKGPWTAEEDQKLANFLLGNGQCCWRAVPKLAGGLSLAPFPTHAENRYTCISRLAVVNFH
jgi:hypothetical protein